MFVKGASIIFFILTKLWEKWIFTHSRTAVVSARAIMIVSSARISVPWCPCWKSGFPLARISQESWYYSEDLLDWKSTWQEITWQEYLDWSLGDSLWTRKKAYIIIWLVLEYHTRQKSWLRNQMKSHDHIIHSTTTPTTTFTPSQVFFF